MFGTTAVVLSAYRPGSKLRMIQRMDQGHLSLKDDGWMLLVAATKMNVDLYSHVRLGMIKAEQI